MLAPRSIPPPRRATKFVHGMLPMWLSSHSLWVHAARVCCSLAICFWSPAATALEEELSSGDRAGFSFDLRLSGGGASAQFTESDRDVVDFDALAIGGAARFGSFVGPHVLLGAELSASWHRSLGPLRLHDPDYFASRRAPSDAAYSVIAPLGVFIELYPSTTAGWFVALTGGLGFIDLPSFSRGSNVVTSGYSLDLGYELSGARKEGPAVFLRYSRWAGEELFVSDYPDGLVSRELMLGLRWTFAPPEWR